MIEPNTNITRRRRMPSLSALRAFEAAARHGSFRAAADELNVTHSAISHQVKALEEYLGVPLFSRGGRAVSLTEEGRILFPVLRESFDSIVAGTDMLRRRQNAGTLTVQTYVTLAIRWLLPRLHSFSKAHPEIQVALSTSYIDWDFVRGEADAGIIQAETKHADLDYTEISRVMLFPVCAPSLLQNGPPLKTPDDLKNHRLLTVYPAVNDWPDWLAGAGVPDLVGVEGAAQFDSYLLALEEAAAGGGVALAHMAFIGEDIRLGRLVAPFDIKVEARAPWYFVCPKERRKEPRIEKFRTWLLNTIGDRVEASGFE